MNLTQTTSAPTSPAPVKGFFIDIDGVLLIEKQLIHGALETIDFLNKNSIPYMLLTNTTRRSRMSLYANLQRMGFKLTPKQIYTAPYAASLWLKSKGVKAIHLYLRGDVYREFKDFRITANKPEYVIIGDVGEDLTYDNLNQVFRLIMGGARMLALQKNRYWQRGDGLAIDAGAIVAALEYATRKRAFVIGKPSPGFFRHAIAQIGLPAENIAMIGDDMESDIKGAARLGLQTIAVQTGKFRKRKLTRKSKLPNYLLSSIAALPGWYKKLKQGEEK